LIDRKQDHNIPATAQWSNAATLPRKSGSVILLRQVRALGSFFDRPLADQGILLRATVTVGVTRLALWVLPARTILRLVGRLVPPDRAMYGPDAGPSIERIGWAVRKAADHVPRASCLTQALAAQLLLSRRGYPSRLCIGVARNASGGMDAHAWIEAGGSVVVGGGELERFTRLPDLTSALSLK
jgi:hypothetical protein